MIDPYEVLRQLAAAASLPPEEQGVYFPLCREAAAEVAAMIRPREAAAKTGAAKQDRRLLTQAAFGIAFYRYALAREAASPQGKDGGRVKLGPVEVRGGNGPDVETAARLRDEYLAAAAHLIRPRHLTVFEAIRD